MKKIAKTVASISVKMAKKASGSASMWGVYQPREPKQLKK